MAVLASVPSLLLLIALIWCWAADFSWHCRGAGCKPLGWVHFCVSAWRKHRSCGKRTLCPRRARWVFDRRNILRHIVSNIAQVVIVAFTLSFTGLVLSETILSYLGIGLDGSWGQMIDQARNELSRTPIIWWNWRGASIALFTLVLAST